MRKHFFLLGIVWLVAFFGSAEAESLPSPALHDDGNYSETFSLTAYGQDTVVQLQFGITNLGWGSGRGICRLYVQSGDTRIRKHEMYGRDEWSSFGTPATTLTAPGCALRTGGRVHFSAELDGVLVEVVTEDPLAPVMTTETWVKNDDGTYRSNILLPASPAEITWRQKGKTNKVQGFAHLDHSVSTLLPQSISSGWLRFRALSGATPHILSLRLAPGATSFSGWQLKEKKLTAIEAGVPRWWPKSKTELSISLPDGRIQILEKIETFEPLRDLGVLRFAAEVLVGKPKTILYWAELDGHRGVLEVSTQE